MEPGERRIEVGFDLTLRVLDWGQEDAPAPVFVLVHGLASNARMWDGVGAALAAAGRRAIAVDLRGHGQSGKPDLGYDFDSVIDDLLALIAAEGLDRPVVVGQSWGGNLALELAWRSPDRIRGACAVDGGVIELAQRFPAWNECAAVMRPPTLIGTRATRMEFSLRAAHPSWPEAGIRGAMANFEVRPDGTIAPWLTLERHLLVLRGLWEHHPSERYAQITTPIMLVPADTGAAPDWTKDKRAGILAAEAGLANSRTHWFEQSDHDLHAQHPERLAALLVAAVDDGFWA